MTRLAATSLILAVLAGCSTNDPGTSLEVALQYDDALQLETADVTLINRTQSASIAHQLLLLIPDELAGRAKPIEVWGRKAGKRAAYGTGSAAPVLGETVMTSVSLTACAPSCQGDMLTTCSAATVACALGCSEDGDAHCVGPRPSNGVDPTAADSLRGTTMIADGAVFNTDAGNIAGAVNREAGTGIKAGIGYFQVPAFASGGAPLAIFVFHDLTIATTGMVRLTGTRAAVLLVGGDAKIDGTIDVAAGYIRPSDPGPGGGAGGTATAAAQGCGAGGAGSSGTGNDDGGGGGGGAGTAGAAGGAAGAGTALGGVAGPACLPPNLEPLQGGSGGGGGGPGETMTPATGGGGGGALQITALGILELTGTINAGGAGGEGGPLGAVNAGSGAGGGSGGAILLEASTVVVGSTAIIAANGGGGGGSGTNTVASNPGANAKASLSIAPGGAPSPVSGAVGGGAGGARGAPPVAGGSAASTSNGGGGGGAVGAIVIRGRVRTIAAAAITPIAVELDVQPRTP